VSRSRRTSVIVCAALVAVAAMLAPPANAARHGIAGLPENESVLFAFSATSGRVAGTSGRRLQLVLDGVKDSGIWFSDRPERDSGTVSTRRIVDDWSRLGFVADPPNAVLSVQRGRKSADTVAIELGRPRLSRSGDRIRVGAKLLRGPVRGVGRLNAKLDGRLQRTFEDATLFIDNADSGAQSCTLGDVDYVAGAYSAFRLQGAPRAQGQLLPIAAYPDLFALLGTRFGGDGRQSFALPNLTGPDPNVFPVICVTGDVPRTTGPYVPSCLLGQVQLTASGVTQPGWLPADGRTLQAEDFPDLAARIGAAFGGDGETTFALPTLPAPPGLVNQVCARGLWWSVGDNSSQDPCTLAVLDLFAVPFSPPEHVAARGVFLPVATQQALFSLLGTTFGGNGESNFVVPDVPAPIPSTGWFVCNAGLYPQFE
jgi:microcystin-dependent protein